MSEAELAFPPLTQPNPPPRPRSRDEGIMAAAVEALMPDVTRWLDEDYREKDRSRIAEQIAEAADRAFSLDGFEIAYALKSRSSWECNAELVEILDALQSCVYDEHRKRVAAWVKANGIVATRSVGDRVKTPWGVGPIVQIWPEHAQYTVQTDEFLTESPNQRGKPSGVMVEFERVVEA